MMENDFHIISSVVSGKTVSQQVKNKIIKKLKVKKKKKQSGGLPFQKAAAFMLKAGILAPLFIQMLAKRGGTKKLLKKVMPREVSTVDDALFKQSGFDKKYLKRNLKKKKLLIIATFRGRKKRRSFQMHQRRKDKVHTVDKNVSSKIRN